MDKGKLKERMMDMKKEMLEDLDKQFCDETNKPHKEWDCKRIAELSEAIYEISRGDDEERGSRRENSKRELIQKINEANTPVRRTIFRRLTVPAACLLLFLGLNTVSLSVFGMNIFSAADRIAKGRITIDTDPNETVSNTELKHYEPSENDLFLSAYSDLIGEPDIVIDAAPDETVSGIKPSVGDIYGIKAKCAEYGLFPDVPEYIPDGFMPIHTEDKHYIECDVISFEFSNGNKLITFDFTLFKSGDDIPDAKTYSNKLNFSEKEINGRTAYVHEEKRQFFAVYFDGNIQYAMYAKNVGFDECCKVIGSLS